MTNALAVISNKPAFLQTAGGVGTTADEFGGGIGQSFPLGVLSIRGKEFRLRKGGQEVPLRTRSLQVVMVRGRPTVSKRFYEDRYAAGSTSAPDCSSTDGARPDPGAPKKQCDTCASCPQNMWGSMTTASGKAGKACSDYKRLVVKIVDMGGGKALPEPVVLDVPATSLRAPKSYRGEDMMLADYVQFVTKNGGQPHQLVTALEFTDAEYPQIGFKPVRWLEQAEYDEVVALRSHEDVETVLADPIHEPPGPISEVSPAMPAGSPPQPAQPPQAAPQQSAPTPPAATADVDIDSLFGGAAPAHTTPAPQQTAPPADTAALAAAEAAAPAGGEPTDDDVMAEIHKILGG